MNTLLTMLASGAIGAIGGAAVTVRGALRAKIGSDDAPAVRPASRFPSPARMPTSDSDIMPQFLRDMRDLWDADESIFWRWDADRQVLVPDSWSTEGEPRPLFFDMIGWGPLVRWAAEEDRPHFGGDVNGSPMIAIAPVRSDRLHGVITVASFRGLLLDRDFARGWIERFASQVASLLSLLERAAPCSTALDRLDA